MPAHMKEKVACFTWQGDILQQLEEIKQIIHPKTGLFPCQFGLADNSNIAIAAIEEWKRDGLPIEGIKFGSTEKSTGSNYKNAMFGQFKHELQAGRIKFPSLDKIDKNKAFKRSFNEWCNVERHKKTGVNDAISAPSDMHDDHPCADVLAVWAIDRADNYAQGQGATFNFPNPITGVTRVAGRGVQTNNPTKGKYL